MTSCVNWLGAVNSEGYPVTWLNGKATYAHRAVMGAQKGEVVLHLCDNKKCVNPDHLKVGTHKENSEDMVTKNRQAKGEACGNSKLTEKEVASIREMQGDLSSRKVAWIFGISKTNVLDIWNNKIWRHLESK